MLIGEMMRSDYSVVRISDGAGVAVHSYYDVCPESPGGERVLMSVFTGGAVPGPAKVVVADRDGREHRELSEAGEAIGHVGRYPLWLDDQRIAYRKPSRSELGGWCSRSLAGDGVREHAGGIRQFHIGAQRGLVQLAGELSNPHGLRQAIGVVDGEGELLGAFDVSMARAAHPEPGRLPAVEQLNFMNAKWDPAGERFFVVFTDELYRKLPAGRDARGAKFKCLVTADADGGQVRFLGDFGHHPHWSPDGAFVFAMMANESTAAGQDVIAYDAKSGERGVLLPDIAGVHSTITQDGGWLIIDEEDREAQRGRVVRWSLANREREVLAEFEHRDWGHVDGHHIHPVLSRDGKRVYFNAQDEGPCQVYGLEIG